MTYKPRFKIAEGCKLYHVSKPTISDWIQHDMKTSQIVHLQKSRLPGAIGTI